MSTEKLDAAQISVLGQKIYDEKYRKQLEHENPDQFVAIEIKSGEKFVAATAEEAFSMGKASHPNGLLYLVRIGSPAAFKISRTSHGGSQRVV